MIKHEPDSSSFDALMTPASVAIIGASDDPRKIGGRPLHYLLSRGYSGNVLPVNPRGQTIQGIQCYRTISDLPEAPELAIVALPAHMVVDTIVELASVGCRSAVIFSAGFAELGTDGEQLQNEIGAIGRTHGMRIVGPNCLGIFNANIGMFATFSTSLEQNTPSGGNIAIASQSGAYASHLSMIATARRMPIGYWFSTGNECDVQVAECIHWLAQRDDVDVIIAYAEGIRDGAMLREALIAAQQSRTIVVMIKVGRSAVGTEAARSHTASLTGSDAVFDCLCRQYGAWRAHDTEEALDVAYAACAGRLPKSRKTGLMTVSGGVGIHMADCAEELGLVVSPMPEQADQKLRDILPYAGTRNPVDVTAQVINEIALFEEFLDITLDEGGYDITIIYFTFVAAVESMIEPMTKVLNRVLDKYPERLFVLSIIAPDDIVARYERTGCIVIEDPWRAVRAAAGLASISESMLQPASRHINNAPVPVSGLHRNEFETKKLLKNAGLAVSDERLIQQPDEAVEIGDRLGWPIVVKIVSSDIPHKTEVGGVATKVTRQNAVAVATEMLQSVRQQCPTADIQGLLIAESISDGIEVIIGIQHDPVFGPVVVLGLGGVFVEVLEDVSLALAPFSETEANRMIDSTRVGMMLDGHRGAASADRAALVTLLLNASDFADRHRGFIQTMDLNPVVVRPDNGGAIVLDALLITKEDSEQS